MKRFVTKKKTQWKANVSEKESQSELVKKINVQYMEVLFPFMSAL
jgi:hypothetical protein